MCFVGERFTCLLMIGWLFEGNSYLRPEQEDFGEACAYTSLLCGLSVIKELRRHLTISGRRASEKRRGEGEGEEAATSTPVDGIRTRKEDERNPRSYPTPPHYELKTLSPAPNTRVPPFPPLLLFSSLSLSLSCVCVCVLVEVVYVRYNPLCFCLCAHSCVYIKAPRHVPTRPLANCTVEQRSYSPLPPLLFFLLV